MDFTPVERLQLFLELHYPGIKLHQVSLLAAPGWLMIGPKAVNIRGEGYPRRTPVLRLWKELHGYYNAHVDVVIEKNAMPTKIVWQGRTYILDHWTTYKKRRKPSKT